MKPNDDQQLASAVSRELKALPALTAPAAIARRVLAAIEFRRQVPWYRRAWVTWPVAWRMASLAAMLVLFGSLCFAGWELSQAEIVSHAAHRVGLWFSGFNLLANLLNTLAGTVALVVKKLGTAFIVAGLVAAGLGYAVFIGLGTFYFRLALTKR